MEGVASECILRLAIVQQIEQLSFRETIVRPSQPFLVEALFRTCFAHRLHGGMRMRVSPERNDGFRVGIHARLYYDRDTTDSKYGRNTFDTRLILA